MIETEQRLLYKRFKTDTSYYIYDAYSNEILRVSNELWEGADRLLRTVELSHFQTPDGPGPRAPTRSPDAALQADIANGRARGYLRTTQVSEMRFCDSHATLLEQVKTKIPQLSLEVTEGCNSRCNYCTRSLDPATTERARSMPWPTVVNAIDLFMTHSREVEQRAMSFWGGEPLLQFALIERVMEYVARRYAGEKVRYSLTTNASLITPSISRTLASHSVHLLVSLDGPAHIHNRHRVTPTGEGTYDATINGVLSVSLHTVTADRSARRSFGQ